jgi:pimeloyl-ACP methyl ester carboxylesterase
MRAIVGSVAAVIAMLAIGALVHFMSVAPRIVGGITVSEIAPSCEPPERVRASAGKLVAIDLREPGDGTRFANVSREAWAEQTIEKLNSETNAARDLVVYAHGFLTDFREAGCAGENLRADLAWLPSYAESGGPDIFVFGWPGELISFGSAQANAVRAGHYLGSVLERLKNRRVILVSHSLGAEVVMTAAGDLPEPAPTPPLAGILLVEGAIPALSIRSWRSTLTETHPFTDFESAVQGKLPGEAFVETKSGEGRFVAAAARAAHLVVTAAAGDAVLSGLFAEHEKFVPSDSKGPIIFAEVGDDAARWITAQPFGVATRLAPRRTLIGQNMNLGVEDGLVLGGLAEN